jgi:diadenosine tetraphosphate (Ap4A) HIT family hydrolase
MTDLDPFQRNYLMDVVFAVERVVRSLFSPYKINLASFGNMTPHLHWHVIPRWQDDRHFPEPIWGAVHNAFPARRSDVSDEDLIEAFRINLPSGNSQG